LTVDLGDGAGLDSLFPGLLSSGSASGERDLDKNVYPLSLETFIRLVDGMGFSHRPDPERERLTLYVQGEQTRLMVHVHVGHAGEGDRAWYLRFLTYSVDFEPRKTGVDLPILLEWLNRKNASILFGRYYYDDETDTVAFEVAMPANGGILGEDFRDLLWISTATVDNVYGELKALVPGAHSGKTRDAARKRSRTRPITDPKSVSVRRTSTRTIPADRRKAQAKRPARTDDKTEE
jgi:hypothetical protein